MNTLYDLGTLRMAQAMIYKRNLIHYANSVLNGDISFDRAVKTLHFDTRDDEIYIEEDLIEVIREICPTKEEAQ